METSYKLYRIREMAEGDEDFVKELTVAFLQEIPEDLLYLKEAVSQVDFQQIKHFAHKMKPTLDLFETGLLENIIKLEKLSEAKQEEDEIRTVFLKISTRLEQVIDEMKKDFNIV